MGDERMVRMPSWCAGPRGRGRERERDRERELKREFKRGRERESAKKGNNQKERKKEEPVLHAACNTVRTTRTNVPDPSSRLTRRPWRS